jgi:L-lactate dehydrogenase
VSHYIEELGVCLSMPAAIGSKGVHKSLKPPLSPPETEALKKSAESMRAVIEKYQKTH